MSSCAAFRPRLALGPLGLQRELHYDHTATARAPTPRRIGANDHEPLNGVSFPQLQLWRVVGMLVETRIAYTGQGHSVIRASILLRCDPTYYERNYSIELLAICNRVHYEHG
jgi:hypothetical protein